MRKIFSILNNKPLFLLLLPAFFVIHGFLEYAALKPWGDFSLLILIYWGVSILLFAFFWLFYKSRLKSALAAAACMAFILFWGSIHDFLRTTLKEGFFLKYSFLVPSLGVLISIFLVFLKRSGRDFSHLGKYLNYLFIVLILLDIAAITNKLVFKQNNNAPTLIKQFVPCDTCFKPDIYLLLTDEYAGNNVLTELFSFDNSEFENELKNRGFHVVDNSKSNYNSTVYSMASLLNMEYINRLSGTKFNNPDWLMCRSIIKNNNLLAYLKKLDYDVINYSFFDLKDHPRGIKSLYFRSAKTLFNAQVFPERFMHDAGYQFASGRQIERIIRWNLYNSKAVDSLVRGAAAIKSDRPRFVYGHLPMPHHPYFFDSHGNEMPLEKLEDSHKTNKAAYIEYLLYSNKKFLELIDYILKNSKKPPIIILMSDHGYRQYTEKTDHKYYFMNLNAVYLPGKDYSRFYDGMTNINQFRVILNTQFGQTLPLLKDSTTFLFE